MACGTSQVAPLMHLRQEQNAILLTEGTDLHLAHVSNRLIAQAARASRLILTL